ncbi:MAG: lipase maturation factor family protein [Gammaproteobacteria bacterium]|nr:lipase maturation factor family protein [Gammaproteobacteria bacterium]MBV9726811.1 lipase maturation factor family protein [Gammaproteobacteria bacterium]
MPAAPDNKQASTAPTADGKAAPVLVYDGDCAFCAYWARYWQRLTGERVTYRPYQEVASDYPAIPRADFQRAVQFITADGERASAAEASFLTLSHAPRQALWLWLYRRLPGFAFLTERAYAFTAAHRPAFFRISRFLFGREPEPPGYELVAFLFLRGFGLIYLAAFLSFAVQAQGLIGSHGILPLKELIDTVSASAGRERFWLMPMVFWWSSSDLAIKAVCGAGVVLSLLLTCNVLPRLALALLYVLYLSLLYAGQTFMSFQWDTFLLEGGFAALILSCATLPGIWLLRWLLFRFMFMSGVVKLLSGDPNWWNLSALSYHFTTQPLPTPLAWYAAHLPEGMLRFATAAVFFIELLLPFLIFLPRRLRFAAAGGIALLELCIVLTGNYNWFNLQTMWLCLPLLDDAALRRMLPARLTPRPAITRPHGPRGRVGRIVVGAVTLLIVFCSLVEMDMRFGGNPPALAQSVDRFFEPLHIVSSYGLFAIMTTRRDEIIIQGSSDGIEWREYEFRYKPGSLNRAPPWNFPHQPRLDWQMWFAALDDPRRLPWFWRLLERLLENEPTVTALLESNPFADAPPTYLRAGFYAYHFSDPAARSRGRWWERQWLRPYFPIVKRKGQDKESQ